MTLVDLDESQIDDIIDNLKCEMSNFECSKNHPKYNPTDTQHIEYERTYIRLSRIVNKLQSYLHPKCIIGWDRKH